jgi:hypothetical protein
MDNSLQNPTAQQGLLAYYTFDNLNNKQGNQSWNGQTQGFATINQTNPNCAIQTDSCSNPLPLTLLNFQALAKSYQVALLKFSTALEQNVSHIDIEKSYNGSLFNKIGTVRAKGSIQNTYEFTDSLLSLSRLQTHAFYRLKMVDKDGQSTYSRVISVAFVQATATPAIAVVPNPAKGVAQLNVTGVVKDEVVSIAIYDVSGKMLLTQKASVAAGNNVVLLRGIGSLQHGLYMVTALLNGKLVTQKLMIE